MPTKRKRPAAVVPGRLTKAHIVEAAMRAVEEGLKQPRDVYFYSPREGHPAYLSPSARALLSQRYTLIPVGPVEDW